MFIYFVIGVIGMTLVMYRYMIINTSDRWARIAVCMIVSHFKQMRPCARITLYLSQQRSQQRVVNRVRDWV